VEFIIGLVIIIVFLLVLGVQPMMILTGILGLTELFLILMTLFFIVSLILVLITKPTEGKYLRIDPNEGVGTHAVYWLENREYDNSFPAEIMFIDKIYHENKICKLRIWKSKKNAERYLLFDNYSLIVIGVGLPVFGALAGVGYFYLMLMISVL